MKALEEGSGVHHALVILKVKCRMDPLENEADLLLVKRIRTDLYQDRLLDFDDGDHSRTITNGEKTSLGRIATMAVCGKRIWVERGGIGIAVLVGNSMRLVGKAEMVGD